MSKLTLLLILFLSVVSYGGTLGTPDSEIQRLEDEVAVARNERDTELLKKDAKPTDAAVLAKERVVEEKLKALQTAFQKRVSVSSTQRAQSNSSPASSVDAPTSHSAPGTQLSGEGIQSEIQYLKKEKPVRGKTPRGAAPSPTPDVLEPETATSLTGEGVTEIQYSKKAKPTGRPIARPSPLPGERR